MKKLASESCRKVFTIFLLLCLIFINVSLGQVPLPSNSPSPSSSPHIFNDRVSTGIPLSTRLGLSPTHGGSGGATLHAGGTALLVGGGLTPTVTSFGVPLKTPSVGAGRFTTLGLSGLMLQGTVGRGIQETKPQGNFRSSGANGFHINELPTSIELDKNLSPVPPYFVFADDDSSEGSLTIGGPKTGGLLPIANPTTDPKLLRLLSQPTVRQRLVAEARADNALKITSILMAHRQVMITSILMSRRQVMITSFLMVHRQIMITSFLMAYRQVMITSFMAHRQAITTSIFMVLREVTITI